MIYGGNDALMVFVQQDGGGLQAGGGGHVVEDGVHLAPFQRRQQLGMAVAPNHQRDLGIGGPEALEEYGELGLKGVPHDAQSHRAPIALLSQPGGHHTAPVLVQNFGTLLEKGGASRCQRHTAGVAVKELDLQLLLQSGDQAAQGRLGHKQIIRRLGKV